jgi:competence ComEA-like helix-hairpin-helix protein
MIRLPLTQPSLTQPCLTRTPPIHLWIRLFRQAGPMAASLKRALWLGCVAIALLALPVWISDCQAGSQSRRGESRAAGAATPPAAEARPAPPLRVDVNTASAAELEQIKGIGPRTAQRIVEAREAGGRFRGADDLRQRVAGIGPAKIKTMGAGGLIIPDAQASIRPGASAGARVDMIVGQPPGKRESKRGTVTTLHPPGSPR